MNIIRKQVLASFNAVEVIIEIHNGDDVLADMGVPFEVVLYAHRDGEYFNSDELPADTLEQAEEVIEVVKVRLSQQDLYDFANGEGRDWLI